MSRQSGNELDPVTGYLRNGYDYINQAWVLDGKYVRCGHSKHVLCWCYGRQHAGEQCTTDGGVRRFVWRRVHISALCEAVSESWPFFIAGASLCR